MRYMAADDIVFTNRDGVSITIKDYLTYPDYTLAQILDVKADDEIDEIATRRGVYGDDAEMVVYKIYDFNIEKLYENDFSLARIRQLRIPV